MHSVERQLSASSSSNQQPQQQHRQQHQQLLLRRRDEESIDNNDVVVLGNARDGDAEQQPKKKQKKTEQQQPVDEAQLKAAKEKLTLEQCGRVLDAMMQQAPLLLKLAGDAKFRERHPTAKDLNGIKESLASYSPPGSCVDDIEKLVKICDEFYAGSVKQKHGFKNLLPTLQRSIIEVKLFALKSKIITNDLIC